MFDIVIIGAGCAGLTAAVYAQRDGKQVLVLENESVGGQINFAPRVENYPGIKEISGMAFSDALCEQAMNFGAQLEFAHAEKIEKTDFGFRVFVDDGNKYECKKVIIATGAKHRKLGIDREDDMIGKGVSYCTLCDGAFYKGKTAAVAGGGSAALQSAELLSGICQKVYLIHRRNEFRGEMHIANRLAQKENVEILFNTVAESLEGENQLEKLKIKNVITQEISDLKTDALFIAIGQTPDNSAFSDIVDCDENGYVITDENCKTSCDGIYAAGDCRVKKVRQLTTAAADGAVSALNACKDI